MKRKYFLILGSMIVIGTVLALALAQVHSVHSGPQASTPTPSGWPSFSQFNSNNPNRVSIPSMPSVVPPKVTDLSPSVLDSTKVVIVVRHADGSREEFLLGPEIDVDAFINHLPKGDKLVLLSPPSSETIPEPPTSTP